MLQLVAAAASRAAAALLGALRGGYNLVRLLPWLAGQPSVGLSLVTCSAAGRWGARAGARAALQQLALAALRDASKKL